MALGQFTPPSPNSASSLKLIARSSPPEFSLTLSYPESAVSRTAASAVEQAVYHSPSSMGLTPSPNDASLPTPSPSTPYLISAQPSNDLATCTTLAFMPDSNGVGPPDADALATTPQSPDVDPQILEALKSKDRLFVLKLGELLETLIKELKPRVESSPSTSYQRLLVHRCCSYYRLQPENDPLTKSIIITTTSESRIPDRRICDLVPAESPSQPAFKIMRRSLPERRPKPQSQAGSTAGEDADLSDVEPSESGSLGGRSNVTSSSSKQHLTIEEREAAYQEARTRIWSKFGEKEKCQDKDMSASSSSVSLTSGSTSTSGGGRSDTDDVSSPATESEWSGPSGPHKKDNRRGGIPNGSVSSSRSIRPGASFHGNNSSSTRNPRATSPPFTYASLYEPPPSGHIYDPSQHHGHNTVGYHPPPQHYAYPYPHQGPNQPFLPPYPYHQPTYNPYQPPPPHVLQQQNSSDPPTPPNAGLFSPPPHQMNYGNPYAWPQHPHQPPLHSPQHNAHLSSPQPQLPPQNGTHPGGPPPPHSAPYQGYIHQPHTYAYPAPYYPPNQQVPLPQHVNLPPQPPMYDVTRGMNGNANMIQPVSLPETLNNNLNGNRHTLGNGVIPPNNLSNGRSISRSNTGSSMNGGNAMNGRNRVPMPPSTRAAWSYGPGVGMGGYVAPVNSTGIEAIGPRFNNSNRRPSSNSNSSNSRSSSNCDDVASTASSSTTSSSSRRTYTSTTSSQHPLPARPDWAVGLKAQPTLAGRHHDISPISPRNSNNASPRQTFPPHNTSVSLQSNDFPPLTSVNSPEKRIPVVTGAWGASRPILSPTNGNQNASPNGNLNHSPNGKQEDSDRGGLERPLPKAGELYNPKIVRRPLTANGAVQQRGQNDRSRELTKADGTAILVGQVSAMSLKENGQESPLSTPVEREVDPVVPLA